MLNFFLNHPIVDVVVVVVSEIVCFDYKRYLLIQMGFESGFAIFGGEHSSKKRGQRIPENGKHRLSHEEQRGGQHRQTEETDFGGKALVSNSFY